MHPREGWTEDRRAGGLSRRGFLKQGAAAGLLAAGAGSLLPGCSSGTTATSGTNAAGGIPLPRPNNPVTWPVMGECLWVARVRGQANALSHGLVLTLMNNLERIPVRVEDICGVVARIVFQPRAR